MALEKHSDKHSHMESLHDEERKKSALILHNDDVHSFDYVIDSLVEVCDHELVQATQCAFLVHYKGKCDVKRGEFERLRAMRNRLSRKGLHATIVR